jgi:thiamine biosynthesis protein ThiS
MADIETKQIQIVVNGQVRTVAHGLTLDALLNLLGVVAERVAVELNREIVRRDNWARVTVDPGAAIEVVQFVGGG